MVEKLAVEIELVGGKQVTQEVAGISKAFDNATKSIAALGTTGADALNSAAAAAQKFGASAPQLQQVEGVINALNARSKDSGTAFSVLATNYDNARANAGKFAQAANTAGEAIAETGRKVSSFRPQLTALSSTMSAMGVPFGGLVSALSRVGPVGAGIGILTVALTGGLAALVKFAADASEAAKQIDELAGVSGRSFERVSALANAFALAGVSTKTFAKDMTALAVKIEEARKQASAEFWGPATEEQKRLANSIGFVAQQWQNVAAGGKSAFSDLTTNETKVQALAKFLGDAASRGQDVELVLADIAKNMTPLQRAEILPKLVSPESIAGLIQGRAAIEQLRQEAGSLGLTLTDANKQALQQMGQDWNQFTGLLGAFFQKIGALAAPAFTRILESIKPVLAGIISDFENLPIDQAIANLGSRLAPAFKAIGDLVLPIVRQIGIALGTAIVDGMAASLQQGAGPALQNIFSNLPFSWAVNIGLAIGKAIVGGAKQAVPGVGDSSTSQFPANEGFAGGGLLGGRGSGTSDSNLAWVSRGEHIMPARAVAQPGVLALLEALRRSGGNLAGALDGMGRFALGGMIPRAMPAFAGGGMVGGHLGTLTLGLPSGGSVSVRASTGVVDQLRKEAALAQVRSGGRKPSRYS